MTCTFVLCPNGWMSFPHPFVNIVYGGGRTAILTKFLLLFIVDKRPEHGTFLPNITLVEADDISKEILTNLLFFTVVDGSQSRRPKNMENPRATEQSLHSLLAETAEGGKNLLICIFFST